MKTVVLPTGPLANGREPAPGRLELVRRFINTRGNSGEDAIATPESLREWLAGFGLIDPAETLTAGDVAQVQAIREALRALASRNNRELELPQNLPVLNQAGKRGSLHLNFEADGTVGLEPAATCVDGAMALLLAEVFRAQVAGEWHRLKICLDPTCLWAYYDATKNNASCWCSARWCGNRDKVRRYRERRRSAGASSSPGRPER